MALLTNDGSGPTETPREKVMRVASLTMRVLSTSGAVAQVPFAIPRLADQVFLGLLSPIRLGAFNQDPGFLGCYPKDHQPAYCLIDQRLAVRGPIESLVQEIG